MVSQITKDFQMKSKLRKLADGGSPNPSMLGTGTAARAGGLLADRGRQIDAAVDAAAGAPAPAPQRVAQAPKKSGLRSMFGFADGGSLRPEDITGGTATSIFTPGEMKQFNAMGSAAMASGNAEAAQAVGAGRAEAAQAAAAAAKEAAQFRGFADGGYNANRYQQSQPRDGGRVKGPGGRTDDKVGPVMLSDEEYVLPGDTADAIGRDKLDAIRLATHEFKDERKESALRGRTDDVPVDHLYDGGSPWVVDPKGTVRTNSSGGGYQWTVDSKGTVRPNSFGDAAAGPGYQQPKLPPPTPGTAVGPSAMSPGGHRTINMGMVEDVTPRPAQIANNPTVSTAAKDPSLWSKTGSALRTTGSVLAKGAGVVGAGMAAKDMYDNGVNVGNSGDLLASGAAFAGPVGAAGAAGWGVGRAIGNNLSEDTRDLISGTINQGVRNVGKFFGQDWGVDDSALLQQKAEARLSMANAPAAAAAPATSALRSDQGPAQPVVPASYQSRRLSEMGVPLDVQNSKPVVDSVTGNTRDFLRTGGTSQFQNLGTYGGDGNIYGKADNPSRPGRINNFVGVGAGANPSNEVGNTVQSPAAAVITSALRGLGSGPSAPSGSNSDGGDRSLEINDRYDKLAKELRGMYSAEGQGNLARRLLELESSRSNALDADARNSTSRGNAQLTADTSRGNAELNARTNMIDMLARMETARGSLPQQAQAAQLKALQDAQKHDDEREEKGFDRYTEAIGQMFTITGKDGEQTVDKAAQERFRAFIEGSDPQAAKKFAAMNPQQQQALLQTFKILYDMNEVRNKTAQSGSWPSNTGGVTNRMDMPTDVREATWNDYWNNNLPLKDYVWSNLPGTNKNVVQTESGQPVLYSDYTATDGKRDLDKEKIVRDSVSARRSALRSN